MLRARISEARAAVPEPWRYYALDASLVHAQTYHAAHGWSGDLTPYLELRALLQPSFNLLFGFEAPDGYANLVPRGYEAIWGSEKQVGIRSTRHLETGDLEPTHAGARQALERRLADEENQLTAAAILEPIYERTEEWARLIDVHEIEPSEESGHQIEWLRRGNLEERLRNLKDAQDRLIDGGYGICGDQINEQRLLANPAASMCFDCQRIAEGEMLCRTL